MKTSFIMRSLLEDERERAVQFIEKRENECTVLMEQVLKSAENVFVLEDVLHGHFCALFYLRNSSTLFHFIPFAKKEAEPDFNFSETQKQEIEKALFDFLSGLEIFCVSGEYDGTLFINSILRKAQKIPVESREYILMENDFSNSACLELEERIDVFVKKCSLEDKDFLVDLERKYRLEEVVINQKEEDEKIIHFVLNKSLMTQCIFCAMKIEGGKLFAVAKAGTNAQGKNYFQLGGVFCREEFRNRKIAFFVIQHLLQFIHSCGKKASLFVKVKNEPAKKLYRNLGFMENGKYEISYFQKQ
ncbi:MAG: GNAT family N-acetyltransferase [Treponema sp.]